MLLQATRKEILCKWNFSIPRFVRERVAEEAELDVAHRVEAENLIIANHRTLYIYAAYIILNTRTQTQKLRNTQPLYDTPVFGCKERARRGVDAVLTRIAKARRSRTIGMLIVFQLSFIR